MPYIWQLKNGWKGILYIHGYHNENANSEKYKNKALCWMVITSFMKACQASCEDMANLNVIALVSVALIYFLKQVMLKLYWWHYNGGNTPTTFRQLSGMLDDTHMQVSA